MAPTGPTRRNGQMASKSVQQHHPPTMSSRPIDQASLRSPLLPTSLESLLVAIYPATLILGSVFSLLEPTARNAPYSPTLQSHPPDQAPSYFALKKNLVNLYFVKINWLWTSLAYLIFLFLNPLNGPSGLVFTPRKLRGLVRYAIVTLFWFTVTQWFFGPALIDRGFRITGGACELADRLEGTGSKAELVSARACKAVGGEWKGGHDISGHVFILVLGSAFLAMEALPLLFRKRGLADERVVYRNNGQKARVGDADVGDQEEDEAGIWISLSTWLPIGVASLSWWMLLMTAAYFHTWFEKFTGLLTACLALFTAFLLPRILPSMRQIVGLPGV